MQSAKCKVGNGTIRLFTRRIRLETAAGVRWLFYRPGDPLRSGPILRLVHRAEDGRWWVEQFVQWTRESLMHWEPLGFVPPSARRPRQKPWPTHGTRAGAEMDARRVLSLTPSP